MRKNPIQAMIAAFACVGLVYVAFTHASNWADWVVLGVIVLTAYGTAVAVNHRRYPTARRSLTRRSDTKHRRPH